MKKLPLISFVLFFVWTNFVYAQKKITREEYIATYKNDAIKEMLKSGIPASITLAQGILESGDGNSILAVKGKNHFGIKCHSDWTGKTMRLDDDKKNECFRKYKTVYESFSDHSDFLVSGKRYAFLFDLKTTNYKGWAKGLKKAGYATNPKYPSLLIKIIEQNKLYQYDKPQETTPHKKDEQPILIKNLTPKNNLQPIKLHNNIKYITAKKGDTFYSIIKNYNMNLWQILKYNDWNKNDVLNEGDIVYLQPKRCRSKTVFHLAKNGESMRDISQLYGVKLKKLYKKNLMPIGTQPNVGDKILLRKKKQNIR